MTKIELNNIHITSPKHGRQVFVLNKNKTKMLLAYKTHRTTLSNIKIDNWFGKPILPINENKEADPDWIQADFEEFPYWMEAQSIVNFFYLLKKQEKPLKEIINRSNILDI